MSKIERLKSLGLTAEQFQVVMEVVAEAESWKAERLAKGAARQARYWKGKQRHLTSLTSVAIEIPSNVIPLNRGKEEKEGKNLPIVGGDPDVSLTSDFKAFWQTYPKRAGNSRRKAAFAAFKAALKHTSAQEIVAGAARYAAYCDGEEKTGTPFVQQAGNWLKDHAWEETYERRQTKREFREAIGREEDGECSGEGYIGPLYSWRERIE